MNKVVTNNQARANDLYLGQCTVMPRENRIVHGEQSVKVEPRVMQVLMILAENMGNVVSREQLVAMAWSGRAITDDAITTCISRLTRVFSNDLCVPIVIKTVSKVGYRLEVKDLQENQAQSRNWLPYFFAVCAFATIIFIYFQATSRQQAIPYEVTRLLVDEIQERQPVFSPDGTLLAYYAITRGGDREIFVRELEGDGVSQLTAGEGINHQPAFSADGTRIAFGRVKGNKSCELRSMSVYGGRETLHASCGLYGIRDLEWTPDGKYLIMLDKAKEFEPGILKQVDVETGAINEWKIVTPEGNNIDDMALSPDGQDLAITVSMALGVEDLYRGPVHGQGPWQRLTFDNTRINGLAWTQDSNTILFTSNRLGPFHLWQVNKNGKNLFRIKEAMPGGDAVSVANNGIIALERWSERSAVVSKSLVNDETEVLVDDKGVNWDARLSPDETSWVYLSDRTGAAELWMNSNDEIFQLTSFNGPWVLSPRWSPDSKRVAFVVPIDRRFQLFIASIETRRIERVNNINNAFSPHWSSDGKQIYYASRYNDEWNIWRMDLEKKMSMQMTFNGAKSARVSADGKILYYSKSDTSGIFQSSIGGSFEKKIIEDLAPVDWNNWFIRDQFIFYVSRVADAHPRLMRYSIETGAAKFLTELEDLVYFSGLDLSSDNSKVWYSQVTEQDADIDLLMPKPL